MNPLLIPSHEVPFQALSFVLFAVLYVAATQYYVFADSWPKRVLAVFLATGTLMFVMRQIVGAA